MSKLFWGLSSALAGLCAGWCMCAWQDGSRAGAGGDASPRAGVATQQARPLPIDPDNGAVVFPFPATWASAGDLRWDLVARTGHAIVRHRLDARWQRIGPDSLVLSDTRLNGDGLPETIRITRQMGTLALAEGQVPNDVSEHAICEAARHVLAVLGNLPEGTQEIGTDFDMQGIRYRLLAEHADAAVFKPVEAQPIMMEIVSVRGSPGVRLVTWDSEDIGQDSTSRRRLCLALSGTD